MLAEVGAVGVIVGAFLPWVSISLLATSQTKTGIDGDGTITLIVALVVGAAAAWKWARSTQILSIVGGLVPTGLGLLYISDPTAGVSTGSAAGTALLSDAVSPEIGLYVTAIAGVVILAAGIWGLASSE